MKQLFDEVSQACSKMITQTYSTSFSLGIYCLAPKFRPAIYSIYGFVRLADEIVDSFEDYDKEALLRSFKQQTYEAIHQKISLNPVLNSFQKVVHQYQIEHALIDTFLESMEADLTKKDHNTQSIEQYILGSAEVVGLMCLHVFTEGNQTQYLELKPSAMKLGAAFQKINFLRDLKDDYTILGRTYFPGIDLNEFKSSEKKIIEVEIEADFDEALEGIKKLPKGAIFGVYIAYIYYRSLFNKIRKLSPENILKSRISIPNPVKIGLLIQSYLKFRLNFLS
jgi:phytoene synthase